VGSVRKDFLWPAATCIAMILAIGSLLSLRGNHAEAQRAGTLARRQEVRTGF